MIIMERKSAPFVKIRNRENLVYQIFYFILTIENFQADGILIPQHCVS